MEISGFLTSKNSTASFTATPAVIEAAATFGLPLPVRQAESVCTADKSTAPTDIVLMSRTSHTLSSPATERKSSAAVCDGNANKRPPREGR